MFIILLFWCFFLIEFNNYNNLLIKKNIFIVIYLIIFIIWCYLIDFFNLVIFIILIFLLNLIIIIIHSFLFNNYSDLFHFI